MVSWVVQTPVNNISIEADKLFKKKTTKKPSTNSFLALHCSKQHAETQKTGKEFNLFYF